MNIKINKHSKLSSSLENNMSPLFAAGSSLIAALATALIGYYVYDTLDKEHVEIANIEVKQSPFRFEISQEIKRVSKNISGSYLYDILDNTTKNKYLNKVKKQRIGIYLWIVVKLNHFLKKLQKI